MGNFETLSEYLEHVSLVMDLDRGAGDDAVQIMTLHSAKGLEFPLVYLPGWEEGVFPSQRSMDDKGEKGLEEERRLAYVGLTRAKRLAKVSFAQNRRTRGLYQSAIPSRFVDDLPEANVEVLETKSPFGGSYQSFASPYGRSRFDEAEAPFRSTYETPGWQRAKTQSAQWSRDGGPRPSRGPITIEGQIIAASTASGAGYEVGARVHHQKFGSGTVAEVDGNKLTIDFDHAGRKRVVDSFVVRA
jgi:DNA helicase-2/ATP-dependent DNA helicase PcrA